MSPEELALKMENAVDADPERFMECYNIDNFEFLFESFFEKEYGHLPERSYLPLYEGYLNCRTVQNALHTMVGVMDEIRRNRAAEMKRRY